MSQFQIGDIVAVTNHAYFKDLHDVKIAGEPLNVLPLMVVIETFTETRTLYSEDTGEKITDKGDGRIKCTWFSIKSNSFGESWFDNSEAKLIKKSDTAKTLLDASMEGERLRKHAISSYKYKDVHFITSVIELGKIKETRLHDDNQKYPSSLSSLLNFVCPPLKIIDVKLLADTHGGRFDSKSGKSRLQRSLLQFKCRYFNASANKWSEVLLPPECFQIIDDVEDNLRSIKDDRENKGYYMYDYTSEDSFSNEKNEPFSILKIDDVTYTNGLYTLKVYDIIHQFWKILEIPLTGISDVITSEQLYLMETYPNFNFKKGDKSIDPDRLLIELNEFIEEHSSKKRYIEISFVNISDKIERRVLKDYFLVHGSTKKAPTYLHGFCCRKRKERSFNFSNIRSIKSLELKY